MESNVKPALESIVKTESELRSKMGPYLAGLIVYVIQILLYMLQE